MRSSRATIMDPFEVQRWQDLSPAELVTRLKARGEHRWCLVETPGGVVVAATGKTAAELKRWADELAARPRPAVKPDIVGTQPWPFTPDEAMYRGLRKKWLDDIQALRDAGHEPHPLSGMHTMRQELLHLRNAYYYPAPTPAPEQYRRGLEGGAS